MPDDVKQVAVLLRGGLGNQLFQYAAAQRVLLDSPRGRLVVLSYGSEWGDEHPDLRSLLGIPVTYPNRYLRSTIPGVAVRETWKDTVSTAMAGIVGAFDGTAAVRQADPFAGFDLPQARRYVLDGFFQHREWWLPSWQQVAERILARQPPQVEALRAEERVVIKLRRSDYVGRGIVLVDAYYRDAIERLGIAGREVTIICEDPSAVEEFARTLAEYRCVVRLPEPITGNVNIDDFWHLAAARTQVLANSSYCWWAAAVAQVADTGARAAYPNPWLPNSWSESPMPDMGIEGWVSVPAEFT